MPIRVNVVSVTLPTELAAYLRQRAKQEDRPLSRVVRQLLELGIMEATEQRLNKLVDSGCEYVAGDPYRQPGRTDI